jgi:hypothetical protein
VHKLVGRRAALLCDSPSPALRTMPMIKNFDDFQKLGQQNVDTAM